MSVTGPSQLMRTHDISIREESFTLDPHGGIYWKRKRWLMVSDLHLGKAAHLRKAGAPLPEGSDARTIARLGALIDHFLPDRVVILGDLFHSAVNRAWEPFQSWCLTQRVELHLVPGNHDRISERRYRDANLIVQDGDLLEEGFRLRHEPPTDDLQGYALCGHVHPGIVISGKARQSERLRCFHVGTKATVLPAFGLTTGLYAIDPAPTDRVFACTSKTVLDVTRAAVADPQAS